MRAIASLSLTFGLVSIPVKLYSATESTAAIRFKLMSRAGSRLRQNYVADVERSDSRTPLVLPSAPASTSRRWAQDERASNDEVASDAAHPANDHVEPFRPTLREQPAADPDDLPPRIVDVERHDMVKGYEYEKGKFVLFTPAELKALQEGARDTIDIVSFIPEAAIDRLYYDKGYLLAPDKRGEKTYSLLLAALRRSGAVPSPNGLGGPSSTSYRYERRMVAWCSSNSSMPTRCAYQML